MAKVSKSGQMVLNMKETTKMERKMVTVALHLLMEAIIPANSKTMKFQV